MAAEEAYAAGADPNDLLKRCIDGLNRARRRAETLPEEWERVELVQAGKPTIEFSGRLLARQSFTVEDGAIDLEIWETRTGALVAARIAMRPSGEHLDAVLVERQDDAQAMQLAVMEHFRWANRARSMARKLGWDLKREVG